MPSAAALANWALCKASPALLLQLSELQNSLITLQNYTKFKIENHTDASRSISHSLNSSTMPLKTKESNVN